MVGGATASIGVVSADATIGRATKALAASADAVILCVGFNDTSEGEGSDRTFGLPSGQDSLIRTIWRREQEHDCRTHRRRQRGYERMD